MTNIVRQVVGVSHSFRVVWVLALCGSANLAAAQDVGAALKGLFNTRVPNVAGIAESFKSIVEVTQGRLPGGAPPADEHGRVVLYRTAWCGYCKRAAAHMQRRNVAFVEYDIEANPSHRADYKRYGGSGGVPLIVFGQETMTGFDAARFDAMYAQFDAAAAKSAATAPGAAGGMPPAHNSGLDLRPGDTLVGRLATVPIRMQAERSGALLATLARGEEAIYMGEERDGLYRVSVNAGEGWVDKLLVKKP